jgi:hypothetical protein
LLLGLIRSAIISARFLLGFPGPLERRYSLNVQIFELLIEPNLIEVITVQARARQPEKLIFGVALHRRSHGQPVAQTRTMTLPVPTYLSKGSFESIDLEFQSVDIAVWRIGSENFWRFLDRTLPRLTRLVDLFVQRLGYRYTVRHEPGNWSRNRFPKTDFHRIEPVTIARSIRSSK